MKIYSYTDCFDELQEAIAYHYVLETSGTDLGNRIKPEYTDLGNRMVKAGVWDGDKLDEERIIPTPHEVKILTIFNVSGHCYAKISIPEISGSDYWTLFVSN